MKERVVRYMSRWFVLGNLSRPIKPFTVNLLYRKPSTGDNAGDLLFLIMYKQILKLFENPIIRQVGSIHEDSTLL